MACSKAASASSYSAQVAVHIAEAVVRVGVFGVEGDGLLEGGQRFLVSAQVAVHIAEAGVRVGFFGVEGDGLPEGGQRFLVSAQVIVHIAEAGVRVSGLLGSRTMACSQAASASSYRPCCFCGRGRVYTERQIFPAATVQPKSIIPQHRVKASLHRCSPARARYPPIWGTLTQRSALAIWMRFPALQSQSRCSNCTAAGVLLAAHLTSARDCPSQDRQSFTFALARQQGFHSVQRLQQAIHNSSASGERPVPACNAFRRFLPRRLSCSFQLCATPSRP